jgi:membrane dipeptidase
MTRRGRTTILAAMLIAWSIGQAQQAEVTDLHARILTLDTHVDIPWNYATPLVDPARSGRLHVDVPKMYQGGLDAAFFIVFVEQTCRNDWQYQAAMQAADKKFRAIYRMLEGSREKIALARSAADVREIAASGRKVALIGIENGFAIGRDITLLQTFFDRGARYMTLVHNGHNDIGDSAQPQAKFGDEVSEHHGLSTFGREVVAEMNRLGMMVDVSHASRETMIQATRLSKSPVIASHSAAKGLTDHPRNLDDEQLQILRVNGGVVQIAALGAFLHHQDASKSVDVKKLREEFGIESDEMLLTIPDDIYDEYNRRMNADIYIRYPKATVSDLVDHIDYVVKLIGVDHVGIASDFEGGGGIVGWEDASKTMNVTRELVARGYSEADIAKIWGGNLLRVLRDNERIAAEFAAESNMP